MLKIIKQYLKKIYKKIKIIFFLSKKQKAIQRWRKDRGDETLRINYNLNSQSIIFDIGGYKGEWAKKIYNKYNCNIYIFEPVKFFFNDINKTFKDNKKIKIFNFGLSNKNKVIDMSIDNDSSSTNKDGANKTKAQFKSISNFINRHKIQNIDLIKINIEGDEYDLLNNLIKNDLVKNIRNIQIQFHDFIPNAKKEMHKIQKKLSKTHKLSYQYHFVWENWEIK